MLRIMKLKLHENMSGAQITFHAQVEFSKNPGKEEDHGQTQVQFFNPFKEKKQFLSRIWKPCSMGWQRMKPKSIDLAVSLISIKDPRRGTVQSFEAEF